MTTTEVIGWQNEYAETLRKDLESMLVAMKEDIPSLIRMVFNEKFDLVSEIKFLRFGCDDNTFIPPSEAKNHYSKWLRTNRLKW